MNCTLKDRHKKSNFWGSVQYLRWGTSLFYGVNWCQFYLNVWISVYFHGSFIILNIDIKGFVSIESL